MKPKTKKRIMLAALLAVLFLPLWMWLAWLLTPSQQLVVAIVDKTEINQQGQEHASLTWILNHERYTKTPSKRYDVGNDYYGFFPQADEKFRIKGLERFSPAQLEKLSEDCDVAYFTDTYGVSNNEWYSQTSGTERSGILYGGLSRQDLFFLQKMKENKKLILTEFNCIGSPTDSIVRGEFEQLFGLRWSGWIGRHFTSLDTTVNRELPQWLIRNYMAQHGGQWPFTQAGVALVSQRDEIEILEQDRHMQQSLPQIHSTEQACREYGVPASIDYPFWFDIMTIDSSINQSVASFELDVNDAGLQLLTMHGLQPRFPAVIRHTADDYRFYYFCADFCDNPVSLRTSYFKGISLFSRLFYSDEPGERGSFFWNYYRPLVTSILKQR